MFSHVLMPTIYLVPDVGREVECADSEEDGTDGDAAQVETVRRRLMHRQAQHCNSHCGWTAEGRVGMLLGGFRGASSAGDGVAAGIGMEKLRGAV